MPPLVSIVTLNWNQAAVTCDLLASLERVTYPRVEVVVVDNGSEPRDLALLDAYYPHPRLIKSPTNLGFTGGNNLGMRQARGEYVLLLNNDTEVEPDFLEPLVAAMEADSGLGACSPKIRYFHEPERIQALFRARLHHGEDAERRAVQPVFQPFRAAARHQVRAVGRPARGPLCRRERAERAVARELRQGHLRLALRARVRQRARRR